MIKLNGVVIEQGRFPDHTLLMKYPEELQTASMDARYEWLYENDSELFTLICLRKHCEGLFCGHTLHLPYVPHARMDRIKNPEDVFTLKYFCEVINSLNFDMVIVRDAHSNVSLALLDRVYQENIDSWIAAAVRELEGKDIAIFFPDEGAMKRYGDLDCLKNYPRAFGIKKRDWKTGKIEGLEIMGNDINGKNVLIIDDICSKGGTFYHSAGPLLRMGAASVDLYVTHLEESVFDGDLYSSGLIKNIYTTPSIMNEKICKDHRDIITILEREPK